MSADKNKPVSYSERFDDGRSLRLTIRAVRKAIKRKEARMAKDAAELAALRYKLSALTTK